MGTFQVAPVVKNLPASAGDARDMGLIPGSGRSPGGGHGNPLQYYVRVFCKFLLLLYDIILRLISIDMYSCSSLQEKILLCLIYLHFSPPSCLLCKYSTFFPVSSFPSTFIFFLIEIFKFLPLTPFFLYFFGNLTFTPILWAVTLVIFNYKTQLLFCYLTIPLVLHDAL